NAGLGWLDAEFGADAILQNTLTNLNELVRKGDVLPFSPDVTFNAGVQYDFVFGEKVLTPRLQYTYVSESYSTPFQSERTKISSRSVFDVKLSLRYSDSLSFDAFVNNLFDDTYSTMQLMNASSADGGTLYGAPRHYGVRVRYDFYSAAATPAGAGPGPAPRRLQDHHAPRPTSSRTAPPPRPRCD